MKHKIRVKHTWDGVFGWLDIRWGNKIWAITWDDGIFEEFWIDEENVIKISEFINNAKGE
jgi:glutamine cyclotransferase